MRSVKFLVAAGAASLLSSMAFAADMPIAPPPMYAPPPVEDFGGWYLRGDIGFSNQSVKNLTTADLDTPFTPDRAIGFDPPGIFGVGVGYRFNNWLRADITASIAARRIVHGLTSQLQQPGTVRRRRQLHRQQVRVGVDGQCLCRSRHLVVHHAVHRRRRR